MLRTLDTQAINPYPLMLTGTRSGWVGKQATSGSKCQTKHSREREVREHVSELTSLTNKFPGAPPRGKTTPPGVKTKGPRPSGVARAKHNKGRPLGLKPWKSKTSSRPRVQSYGMFGHHGSTALGGPLKDDCDNAPMLIKRTIAPHATNIGHTSD